MTALLVREGNWPPLASSSRFPPSGKQWVRIPNWSARVLIFMNNICGESITFRHTLPIMLPTSCNEIILKYQETCTHVFFQLKCSSSQHCLYRGEMVVLSAKHLHAIRLHGPGGAQWGGSALAASTNTPSPSQPGHMPSCCCRVAETQTGPAAHAEHPPVLEPDCCRHPLRTTTTWSCG